MDYKNCIVTKGKAGKYFRILAEHYDVSISDLQKITYKYRNKVGNSEAFPTEIFIKAELGKLPYVESSDTFKPAKRFWDASYSKPQVFDSAIEANQAKTLAESYFPKNAVHLYENSQGKQVLVVQEPVEKLPIQYRKDFSSWQEYNDYLMLMGDLIPESERQKEEKKVGPQEFTFNDGVSIIAPFQPNEQQVEALNVMSDFIDSDETSMTLSGYAGTGKTSLMEMIAAKMKKQHKNIVFSASTNKAAAVLRDRVKKSGFTAQTLNKVFGIQVEVDSSKPYDASNLVNKLKEAEITPGTIVVIDEASMINEENYAILNNIARENDLKIIYTGDKGQLAPVNESQVSKVFRDKNGKVVTLTKVERTDDNAILKEATAIRNGQPLSGESSFNSEGKGVAYIRPTNKAGIKAIVEKFVPVLKSNPDYFRILAYTNKAVADYNTAVRNALGYHDNTPRVGEPIVGYNNWGAEYDRRTKQTTYRFINSESYKVTEVKPSKQVSYMLDNGTTVTMTAVPITIEDAMGKKEKIDLMDIKGNPHNLQAATILAKEKARLFDVARHSPRREQPAIYSKINGIDKFLFVNDNIMEGSRKLQSKTFDFGYAMTVHKSQGSTFTHVLMDDADISTARDKTVSANDGYSMMTGNLDEAMRDALPVDLGLDSASSEMQATSQGNLLSAISQPTTLNTENINRQSNNAANIRQQLEYVAVSRATDTVTIISNNVKTEDSPLNHLPKAEVSEASSLETNRKEMTPQLIQQVQTILSPLGNKVHGIATMQKYLQEHPDMLNIVQQFMGKKARTQFEQSLRKARSDMSDAEIQSTLDFLHSLEDNKENTAYIKTAIRWVANHSITLPQDNIKARQAFDLARKKHIDLQKYNTLGELITAPEMQPKKKEKVPFNPDKAKTFSNKKTVTTEGGRIFTVYDVEDTEEGQREVCRALAAHYGMSPWCLSTFTATGEPTESARKFWAEYSGVKRKIAFENGKPVAFSSDHGSVQPRSWLTVAGKRVPGVLWFPNMLMQNQTDGVGKKEFEPETLEYLLKNGYIERNSAYDWVINDDAYRLTEKGEQAIGRETEQIELEDREAWWDMEDSHPQASLSDSIVSEYKTPEQQEQAIEAARNEALQEQYEEYLRTGFPEPVNPDQEEISDLPFFMTPDGEVYGFVAPNGDIYLDDTKISPEHPIHEYTHLWDRIVAKKNPKLWKRGIQLMKKTSLWKQIENDTNYGQRWKALSGMTNSQLESLIASEVHARFVGEGDQQLLDNLAKEKGAKGIIGKLRQWILDFWKDLKATFSDFSDEEIQKLTLKDFNHMTMRDFADAVNFAEAPSFSEFQGITPEQVKQAKNLQRNKIESLQGTIGWIEERRKWNKATKEQLEELTKLQQDLAMEQGLYDGLDTGTSTITINKYGIPQITAKEAVSNTTATKQAPMPEASPSSNFRTYGEAYTTTERDDLVQELLDDGYSKEDIQVQYIPATETEDDYYLVKVRDYSQALVNAITGSDTAPVTQKISLPGYEYFNDLYEDTEVDAAWKIPILQDLDSQLSTENTEDENLQILSQMNRVLQSPSQEDYEKAPTPQKEETNQRMTDYKKRNQQLNNLLDNNVGLQASEIRETAETIMNTLSDIITEIQQNPEKAKEYWPTLNTTRDISKATRKEIVGEIIGVDRLIALAKKRFDDLKWSNDPAIDALYNSGHLLDQHDLIMANWDAVMRFAGDIFTANEGFGIKRDSKKGKYNVEEREYVGYDYDDYSSLQDQDAIAEEADEQEHWQVEAKTIDVINSMSELVRMAIHDCYVLDKNGNKVLDKWGMPKRVDKHKAVKQILYWTSGTLNINEMIDRLEAHKDRNPWVSQLTKRLADKSGNEADFQSQFYGVMHRHFQLYGIGQYENGHYVHKILNRHNALSEVLKGISAQFQMHQHPLFNRDNTINRESLKALEGWYNELEAIRKKYNLMLVKSSGEGSREDYVASNNLELSDADIEAAAKALTAASKMLGFMTTEEDLLPIINKDSLFRMTNALMLMLDREGLKAQAQSGKKDYQPFEFKKENNIRGALTKFLQPMMEELEETALSTIFEDGKMYQSNTIPSFLSQLFDSFAQPEENFKPWAESFYGNSQWFKAKDGRWRTPWLLTMMTNPEARKVFEHHVQLNFNKHNYMRNMSPEEYTMSCITNYFFSKTNEKNPDSTPAWFRVPIQSNKPSSEFIKFFSYRGTDYKDKIVSAMQEFFLQELDRIDTVRKRNKQEGDASTITSWDENGKHFMFMPFLNSYLMDRGELVNKTGNDLFKNPDNTTDTQKNNELKELLNKKLNAEKPLTPEEDVRLSKLVEEATRIYMQNTVGQILDSYEQNGILKAAERVENINDNNRSIKENVENFLWNDFFAANNILQLTITDKAFYPTTAELQKRLAELHAPGIKANKYATDYKGNRVSDGTYRTILISDYEGFTANIIDNLTEIFDRKIAQAPKEEKAAWRALKESLVGENGRYRKINVTDGQAYSSPASYRKKMLMFGKWSIEAETAYQKIRSGNFTMDDLNVAFQPLKPFVYGHLHKKTGTQNAPIQEMNVPFQAKNSEYLLIIADALMQGQETGRPNLLKAIYEVMEESEELFPTKGIDTVQFNSAIKSGAQGVINLSVFTQSPAGEEQAKTVLREQMYVRNDKNEIVDYNYDTFVQSTDYDNYALQQEVPKHFQEHMQAEPSQKRANIMSDLDMWLNPQGDKSDPANINYYTWKDPDGTEHKLTAQEFRKEYENVHAKNIEESFNELTKLFHLDSLDRIERNIALSELLQEEIESSPRYGIDLMQACQIDPKTGDFRIPKGDPVQSKRIEQLINSIIKSRINKQKLAGGPIVQVTNWGTSKQLHIRFNDKQGNLLPTKEEYEAKVLSVSPESKPYKEFIKENQAGIAHFEIFAPAAWKKHLEKFRNPDGTINLEAIERCDPNLLRMITSRIPNEDKYSIAHGKIVGFLPEVAGEAIMFPYELTEIDDSDFDVDKRYCHIFEIEDIVEDTPKVKELLFKAVSDSYKKSHNGEEMPYNTKKKVNDSINMLLDNPEVIRHTDRFSENLYNAYQNILHTKFPYKVKYPKKGTKGDRNNQILNMDWAVMSNEMTASKILNPGGFDTPKHDAYVIAVYRATNGKLEWKDLNAMTTKQLQKLMPAAGDLAWFNTQVQFYKQNAAGSNLIGVFAVNKVAHAFLEADDILIDVEDICGKGNAFSIAGEDFVGRIPLDPSQDSEGAYIGKGLGSMVGASADTAKDPWLDLIGINMTTAAVYNTLLRLGMPQRDAALFMAQDVLVSVLGEYNRTNLEETTTLDAIISKRLTALSSKYGFTEGSTVNSEPLTRNELRWGLVANNNLNDTVKVERDKIDYKVLLAFQKLQNLAKAIRKPTLATRLNSISSAVGPLIIDNIILEHKLMQFLESENEEGTGFYDSAGNTVDIDDLFYNHPMLREFSRAIDSRNPDCPTKVLFADMPAGSRAFKGLLESLPVNIKDKIYDDRQLLSKLSDFYQSYMLVANEIIKPEQISNYIKGFPQFFVKENLKEKYPNNEFIQAIQLTFDKKTGRGFLNINTTGMMEQEKERLRMAWTDLHKQNPKLSTQLFTYAFFRGGIGFSPKTWMGLVPTYVKEHLTTTRTNGPQTSYVDTYRHFPTDYMVDEIITEQFVRNNWDNSKLAPKKGGEGTTYDYSHLSEGILMVHAQKDKDGLADIQYMRTDIDKKTYLWKRVTPMTDKESSIEFKRIMPLGNNGEYVEMSMTADMKAMEIVEELRVNNEQPELPASSPKDAATEAMDSTPVTPKESATQQAKNVTELVPIVMKLHNLNEGTAVSYLETLKNKALNGTISKFSKEDIQRIAKENGLNLDVEKALDWFKKLC